MIQRNYYGFSNLGGIDSKNEYLKSFGHPSCRENLRQDAGELINK